MLHFCASKENVVVFLQIVHSALTRKKDIHLTNVAIQKTAPDYDPEKVGLGGKYLLLGAMFFTR